MGDWMYIYVCNIMHITTNYVNLIQRRSMIFEKREKKRGESQLQFLALKEKEDSKISPTVQNIPSDNGESAGPPGFVTYVYKIFCSSVCLRLIVDK